LLLRGIKPMTSARDLVARARQQAGMDEADAIALAVEETRRHRAREERAPDGIAA
jgi:hypothetical protein